MALASAQTAPTRAKVSIEGGRFRVDYPDGSSLSGMQLAGKEIVIGAADQTRPRIDAIMADQTTPDVWLHDMPALGAVCIHHQPSKDREQARARGAPAAVPAPCRGAAGGAVFRSLARTHGKAALYDRSKQ